MNRTLHSSHKLHCQRTDLLISKEDFCHFCTLLYERHLVTGFGGNLSVRAGDKVYTTPSGYSLRDVVPERVVVVDDKGEVLEGGVPTKELGLHLGILGARSEINAVCHAHGAYIIAATILMEPGPDSLPPITPGLVCFAHPLPLIPFKIPGTDSFFEAASRPFIDSHCRAVLLQNHGMVTVGKDFWEAINMAEEIDEAAKIFVLTQGNRRWIPEEDMAKIKAL